MSLPPEHAAKPDEQYQPLALVGVTLIALGGFAAFFLSFLVAPLAILVLFYVGFAAADRSKRNGSAARLKQEAEARQSAIERAEGLAPPPRAAGTPAEI